MFVIMLGFTRWERFLIPRPETLNSEHGILLFRTSYRIRVAGLTFSKIWGVAVEVPHTGGEMSKLSENH